MAATVKFYNTYAGPATDLQLDLGAALFRWNRLYALNLSAGGIDYVWPTTQTSNFFLKTNGTGTLSWADPAPGFVTINKWSTDN